MAAPALYPAFLWELLGSPKYSDMELVCEGETFPVHRAVMCTQSPVLAAACDGNFMESLTKSVKVEAFDIEAVKYMIEFMYTSGYQNEVTKKLGVKNLVSEDKGSPRSDEDDNENDDENDNSETKAADSDDNSPDPLPISLAEDGMMAKIIMCHVKANSIADYYNIPPLKTVANQNVKFLLDHGWQSKGFADVIAYAFEATRDKELHELLATSAARNAEELYKDEDFVNLSHLSDFSNLVIGNKMNEIRILKEHLELLKVRLQVTEERGRSERIMCQQEKARGDRIIANVDQVLSRLFKTSSCDGEDCDAEFPCHIEKKPPPYEPKYILRCTKCNHSYE